MVRLQPSYHRLLVWCFLVFLALSALARADAGADFDRLKKTYDQQYEARKYQEAEQTAIELCRLAEQELKDKPALLASAMSCRARACHWQRNYAQAEQWFQKSLAIQEKVSGPEHLDVASTLRELAQVYSSQRRYDKVVPLLQRVLAIREKAQGPDHLDVAQSATDLGYIYGRLRRYAAAEPLYRRALAIREKNLQSDDPKIASSLGRLAWLYTAEMRYAAAEPLCRRALAIREKALRPDHPDLIASINSLAWLCSIQSRYAEAERLYQRALAIQEKSLRADHPDIATSLSNLGKMYTTQSRCAEAEPLLQRALAIREKAFGPDHLNVASSLYDLGWLYSTIGRYGEAEPLYQRARTIQEKRMPADAPAIGSTLNRLAWLYSVQGRYAEAESLYQRALAIREKAYGAEHPDVATTLHNLALLYVDQARYAEAESLYRRALAIREKRLGSQHPDVATTLNNLAWLYKLQGRYAEAEPLLKRSLAIRLKIHGSEHRDVASTLNNLAALYKAQGRYAEAEPRYKRSLAIWEKALGGEHLNVATSLNNLANLYEAEGRHAEAEPLFKRSLAIMEKILGGEHPDIALGLNNLAILYIAQRRYAEAERLYQQAIAIREKTQGPDHPAMAQCLDNLARVYYQQEQYEKAEPLIDRAIDISDRAGVAPGVRYRSYLLRARIAWKRNLRSEALADLHRAIQLAEQQRSQSSGAAHERAETFGRYSDVFEQMLIWQLELKDMNEVLSAMERGRARSLLDEMTQAGVDLLAGRPAAERQSLRKRQQQLEERIDLLGKQLDSLDGQSGGSPNEKMAKQRQLLIELAKARNDLYEHYRDVRGSSPVYYHLLSTGSGPPRLSQIQRRLAVDNTLLLVYLFGSKGGYLLAICADRADLYSLTVEASEARILRIKPGPLTAARLADALVNQKETGIVQQLRAAAKTSDTTEKLAALWKTLLPEASRQAITSGKIKRLIVVPDGKLALLPFEALVVKPDAPPLYLLDAGPPILYAPSATVLYNLAGRTVTALPTNRAPVLTVGNPLYETQPAQVASPAPSVLGQMSAGARFSSAGGKLAPLPFSGMESQWVADAFAKQGLDTVRLDGVRATKANLLNQIEDRRIVHIACHGLADQSYGNFYGALALAPGSQAQNVTDDGFLTLAEIYQLDLKGCELAILSACETNFGPQQKGEGVWALSRGFLVAGSRRVVASDWLVDDEAAARLISRFCSDIAESQKADHAPDYAEALQQAKRSIRHNPKHPEWENPFYWAPFVLVGPN